MKFLKYKKSYKQLLLSLAVIGAGVALSTLLIATKPDVKKAIAKEEWPLVETAIIKKTNAPIVIQAQGQIEPAQNIRLHAEVSGKIIYAHPRFIKGGYIKKGDILIKIDPQEYELALAEKNSILAAAKLNLALEKAHHEVAVAEFSRHHQDETVLAPAKALATRAHNFEKAQREYEAALAQVAMAERVLKATVITSPVNAVIATCVNPHEFVFARAEVARIYGSDEFLAEVNIPINELSHVELADTFVKLGSKAVVSQLAMNNTVIERTGVVARILPDLGPVGHMARLVVVLKDPFSIKEGANKDLPLLANAKVSVQIYGKDLKEVFAIPRHAVFKDDSILIVGADSTLSRIKLNVVRRERDYVYAFGDELDGLRVIVSKTNDTLVGQRVRFASTN